MLTRWAACAQGISTSELQSRVMQAGGPKLQATKCDFVRPGLLSESQGQRQSRVAELSVRAGALP